MGRGFGLSAAVGHDVVRELAGEAERLGYTSFWANDMPHAGGLETLAAAGQSTSTIRLGVGVIPLDKRPPATIVATIESLGLPRDRLVLGVGSGGNSDALARVLVGIDELRDTSGAMIVVGALGPKMTALAAEVADGVLLNWMTPDHAMHAAEWAHAAATHAKRPTPALMTYVRCGLVPGAEARLREEVARYAGNNSFAQHEQRMGVSAYDSCVLRPDRATLQAGIAPYEAVLDESIVRVITPTDSLDDLLMLLRACAPPAPETPAT